MAQTLLAFDCKTVPSDRAELFYIGKQSTYSPDTFGILIYHGEDHEGTIHMTHEDARRLAEAILTKLYIPDKENT